MTRKARKRKYKREDVRSDLEFAFYKKMLHDRVNKDYEIEFETEKLEYTIIKSYNPDWILKNKKNNKKIYLEVKGYLRPEDRTKLLAVKRCHPDIDIRLLFDKDNKLSRTSQIRYSDWCQKHNIPFAVGNIPKGWFNE